MSTEANCEHQWWVYSSSVVVASGEHSKILVQCRLCKVLGSTEHYTKEEWEKAHDAPIKPFEWEGTVEHIGKHDNQLAAEIPDPDDEYWNEMAADQKVFESSQAHNDQIIELIKKSDDMFFLSGLKRHWEARMKKLAAEILKPDSDEVIDDLTALDYLWGLGGDCCMDSEKVYHPRALDYYLGRIVALHGGGGKIVRFIKSDEWMADKDREHFKDHLVVSDEFRGRGYRYGIALKQPCSCGKVDYDMYAIPGIHTGAFGYQIMEGIDSLFDVRNHCMTCDDCGPKVQRKNEELDRKFEEQNAERSGETTGDSGESG